MTATNHALTGAAIATIIKQPLLAVPLAFVSHFVCDALPHFGLGLQFGSKKMWRYLQAEAFAMTTIGIFLLIAGTQQTVWLLMLCGFAAMSPDLAWYFYGKKGVQGNPEKMGPISRFHARIQWSETKWGIVPELFWAIVMITIIV